MEPKGSLPCSPESTTDFYPEPDSSSPTLIYFLSFLLYLGLLNGIFYENVYAFILSSMRVGVNAWSSEFSTLQRKLVGLHCPVRHCTSLLHWTSQLGAQWQQFSSDCSRSSQSKPVITRRTHNAPRANRINSYLKLIIPSSVQIWEPGLPTATAIRKQKFSMTKFTNKIKCCGGIQE
jgi:hypothetical protein